MFCTNCGEKLSLEQKFCINCGNTINDKIEINSNFSEKIFENTIKKNNNFIKILKNIVLFLCLYFSVLAALNGLRDSYYSDDNVLLAIAPTILIIYVWRKIEKRFKL